MFDFLFEGGVAVYLLLLVIIFLLVRRWKEKPERKYLVWVGVVALLGVCLFLFDLLRETDEEKARRTLDEMIANINAGNLDQAFAPLADDFRAYRVDRKGMKDAAAERIRQFAIRNIRLRSVDVRKKEGAKRTITIRFNAVADSNLSEGWGMAPSEVDFVIDEEGRCRVKTFRIYHPIRTDEEYDPFP
jgi:hypothetical protein